MEDNPMLTADDFIQGKPNPEAFAENIRRDLEFIKMMENKITTGKIEHNDLVAMLEKLKVYFTTLRLLGEFQTKQN